MSCKHQFPIFSTYPDLVYLDNAATTHKPQAVVDAVNQTYTQTYANIGRGNYPLAATAENLYESARERVAQYIGARMDEVIFTAGCTDSVNQLATMMQYSKHITAGDEIIITQMEHHANFLPWQQLATRIGAHIKIWTVDAHGELDKNWLRQNIHEKTNLIAITHVCNATGVVNPVHKIIQEITSIKNGGKNTKLGRVITVVDGAQAVAHHTVNVREIGCDAYVFSGHKMYAPTGIGVLYGQTDFLQNLTPAVFGGGAVELVRNTEMQLRPRPWCFEPGTPKLAEANGLAAAIDFLNNFADKEAHIADITKYTINQLRQSKKVDIVAHPDQHLSGIISFVPRTMHPLDFGTLLGMRNIAIRTGSHCTQPLMHALGYTSGTCRVSLGLYNDHQDIDRFITQLKKI